MELVRRAGSERPTRPTPFPESAVDPGDRYVIEREIGRGSVATVYLARDRKHAREVALKVLKPEVGAGSDRRRFEREIGINIKNGNNESLAALKRIYEQVKTGKMTFPEFRKAIENSFSVF
jgi:serine/threonine protein kinase